MKPRWALAGFLVCWALAAGGCVSLAEIGGRVLDGSAFAEKTLASYREGKKTGTRVDRLRQKKGPEFIAIRIDSMPNLRIKGALPDDAGNFYLTSLDFLSPNISGWNEFTMDLSGGGNFIGDSQTGALQLAGPVETLDISEGKIRRGSARLSGVQALRALHNRRERIIVIAEWMKEQPGLPDFADQEAFEAYWKPRLFPEIVRRKERPSGWNGTYGKSSGDGAWVLGDDIKWNTLYTKAILSEELWPVRNSGTLLRDWEEAAAWIYLEFKWEYIVEFLSKKIELKKIK